MSIENPTFTPVTEKGPKFPSLEEIKAKIEALIPKKDQGVVLNLEEDGTVTDKNENLPTKERREVLRTLEDKDGVYLYETVVIDEAGDAALYSYRRAGNYSELRAANTVIDITYFEGSVESGMPVGGHTLSNYDEASGEWTDTK
ncbi:MAG: hypothetical protein KBD65_02130 [Candidatus Moranbacteria bacterium]|nr:hypothetical protein [Candidatus Moranbacteria bacterium]